jgi:hypothetical protein
MADVDCLELVMRIHRAAPRPPSAAEVLMAVSRGSAHSSTTGQSVDHVDVLRADCLAMGLLYGTIPQIRRYAGVVDPGRSPAEALEVAHQVMCAVPIAHRRIAAAIGARHPAWNAVIEAVANTAAALESGRNFSELPSEVGQSLPGETLRFEIRGHLGSGGSADVMVARDRLLTPKLDAVAIKFSRLTGPWGYERLREEAERAASARHPCAVSVLDVGIASAGIGYIAFERVRGAPLTMHLAAESEFTPEHACLAVAELADAIDQVHAQGFAHGDITLANTLLDDDGRLRLVDFGVGGPATEDAREWDCACLAALLEVLLVGFAAPLVSRQGEIEETLDPDWIPTNLTLRANAVQVCRRTRHTRSDMRSYARDLRQAVERARMMRLALVIVTVLALVATVGLLLGSASTA